MTIKQKETIIEKKPELVIETKQSLPKEPSIQTQEPPKQQPIPTPEITAPKIKEKKTFELLDLKTGESIAKYTGSQPRNAAMKAAATGVTDILLREVASRDNTKGRVAVLHGFTGTRKKVSCPLPYPFHIIKIIEHKAGKSIPLELNVKGKEKEMIDAGFDYQFWKPHVLKIGFIPVPVDLEKGTIETIREFVKKMGK